MHFTLVSLFFQNAAVSLRQFDYMQNTMACTWTKCINVGNSNNVPQGNAAGLTADDAPAHL